MLLIRWIVIYPVNRAIQRLNNQDLILSPIIICSNKKQDQAVFILDAV